MPQRRAARAAKIQDNAFVATVRTIIIGSRLKLVALADEVIE